MRNGLSGGMTDVEAIRLWPNFAIRRLCEASLWGKSRVAE